MKTHYIEFDGYELRSLIEICNEYSGKYFFKEAKMFSKRLNSLLEEKVENQVINDRSEEYGN